MHLCKSIRNLAVSYAVGLQVNQMGGEIKFVNKKGPGSLMQLYLLLRAPIDGIEEHRNLNYSEQNLTVSATKYQLEGALPCVLKGLLQYKNPYLYDIKLIHILGNYGIYQSWCTIQESYADSSNE